MNTAATLTIPTETRRFEAVAIGASAGGVSALLRLLGGLPASFPLPVLVVLHLPRDKPSTLTALFEPHCALPVNEALDKQPLSAGIWLAPPDYHLLVEVDRTLALSVDEPVLFSRPAIDPLFESAAAVFAEGLLAILLTGASTDGSAGVAAVRHAGGTAWVQSDAPVTTMPAAALATAGADAVLTLDDMRDRLAAYHHTTP